MSETRSTPRPNRRTGTTTAPPTEPTAPAGTATSPAVAPARQVPAYAAGSGSPTVVLDGIGVAGLRFDRSEDGNTWITTGDGRLLIEFGPETHRYLGNPLGGLWLITYTDPEQPTRSWRTQFGDQVPAEAITAFIKVLLIPAGLDPDRADRDEPDTKVTIQITAAHTPKTEAEEQAEAADQPNIARATAED